ncbi:hypothetical protein BKA65DRAFT_623 [Rhexocercosporidium sp. MPI-PUGE-AT-0058]|nr:hypothetical protein BKA65DRAFT_623 [Rhexocercosporidium sp. MPI-PUGE-AT-0058]
MATDPPLIQVAHLPSAASFYGSLTQPLGLQFLSATPVSPACLHFGYVQPTSSGPRKVTVFTVSQAAHPRLSHITLSAPSPKAVYDFHGKSQLLNQDRGRGENTFDQGDDEERALTRDFDGNMIEAVYSTRAQGSNPHDTLAIEPAGLDKESKRVLEWQQDVARSISGSQAGSQVSYRGEEQAGPGTFRRADTFPSDFGRERPMRLVRRETVTTEHYSQAERERERKEAASKGISGKAVLGTLLGAAAGAAFAYAMTRSESPPSSSTIRRSSAPQYTHEPIRMEDRERVVETRTIPARSYVSERARDRDVQPRYVQYTIAAPPARIAAQPELARIEERSHVSTRSRRSGGKEREGSEVSKHYERPLTILPAPSRDRSPASHVSHRTRKSGSGSGSGSSVERERRRESPRDREREAESEYMSARSHHSASTIKPAVPQPPSSRVSSSTIRIVPQPPDAREVDVDRKSYISERDRDRDGGRDRDRERRSTVSARQVPLPPSTVMSARQVPLPRSMASGGGYAASVAPSDSVSSVGSKRERERLRERMHVRGPAGVLCGVMVRVEGM